MALRHVRPVEPLEPAGTAAVTLEAPPVLKVALAIDVKSVRVACDEPCAVLVDGRRRATRQRLVPLQANASGGRIVMAQGRLTGRQIVIAPVGDGLVRVNGAEYRGAIHLSARPKDRLLAVNVIGLEPYLCSVVGAEMPSRWPASCLISQAVAARSYALAQWMERRESAYHLAKSELAYRGASSESDRVSRCVAASRGVVLAHDENVLSAYYHSVCGGHTTPVERVFDVPPATPLAGVDCPYCRPAKFYEWRADVPRADAVRRLSRDTRGIDGLSGLRALGSGPDHHATHVAVSHQSGTALLSARRFRALMGPDRIRSTAFRAVVGSKTIQFRGRGWGHGVGLCQWGARGMAREGKPAVEILAHYYPTSDLVKIY